MLRIILLILVLLLPAISNAADCVAGLPSAPPTGSPCGNAEANQLDFGLVVSPSAGSRQIVINKNSTINSGATTITSVKGSVSKGLTKLRGTKNSQITINFVSSNTAGFTLKDFTASYSGNFTDTGSSNDVFGPYSASTSGVNLVYGATLVVGNNVAPGTYYINYEIRVYYSNCSPCTTTSIIRQAKVTVINPIEMYETQPMDFGKVFVPTSSYAVIRLGTNNSRQVISGNIILAGSSGGRAGTFSLRGQEGYTISMRAAVNSVPTGLSIANFKALYNGSEQAIGSNRLYTIHNGSNVYIGAELKITRNTITQGHKVINYSLTVDYN